MSKKTILCVEDNPVNMKLLRFVLRAGDYILVEAADGEAALELARSERPDLIIMDIHIPKMDGCEVARRIRGDPDEAIRKTRILALTAYAMAGDRDRILASGCDAYMTKPVDTRTLRDKVVELLSIPGPPLGIGSS